MSPNSQKTAIKFLTALLKHQAEIWLGKDAAGIAAETLIDEDLQKQIDGWLLKEETAKQLLDATSNADNYFRQNCDDDALRQAISLGFGDLPAVQTALTELPQAMDSNAIKQALQDAFARDLPNLTVEQYEYGAELYTDALLRAVGGIEKFVFPILVQSVLDLKKEQKVANNKLDIILARLETRTLLYAFYVPPEDVFKRVRVEDFIGRKWLIEKIDQFLNNPNRKSGAFLIEGKAGLGKSAFMAYLVKSRNYFHLFGEQFRGDSNVGFAVRSLAAQLIAHFNLSAYKNIDLEKLADSPHFLQGIFNEAAGKLGAGEKIIIVCDALDEAGNSPDGRVFGLPNTLPDGVYLILSQRPVPTKLPTYDKVIQPLKAESHENLEDVDDFLRSVARRKEVKTQLLQKNISEERFIQTLKAKSEGVWIYLYYVLDIQHGYLLPLNLENLPLGLAGYYHRYWSEWQNGTRGKGEEYWDSLYAPLLATLAALQQAVDVTQLIAWTGVQTTSSEVTRLLRNDWRAFITEREETGELGRKHSLYIPYHLSFRDFFTQKELMDLSEPEANFARELAELTTEAHIRITADFQRLCNGKWEELVSQPYPRQHLSTHLALSGDYETLRTLLTEGNEHIIWAEAKYEANGGSYAGYLADLQLLWHPAIAEKDHALLTRLMLIENSIRSLATNIFPELLSELAKAKMWSLPRCLDVIRQNSNTFQQVEAIKLFAPLTNSEPSQQKEVLDIAREIKDESDRASALSALAPHLNEELKAQALTAARGLKAEYGRVRVLSALAPHLNEELKAQALTAARELIDEYDRANAMSALAPHLNEELKAQVLQEALTAARELQDEYARVYGLSALASHLNEELKAQVLQEALTAAREIKEEDLRVRALSALAPHLNEELKAQVLQEALTAAREIIDESDRVYVLSELAPHLNEELKAQALTTARELISEYNRASALSALAPHLNEELKAQVLQEALTAARELKEESTRVYVSSELAPHLNEELKAQVLQEALTAAREIKEEYFRASALSELAPHLNEELKEQVLQEALYLPSSEAILKIWDGIQFRGLNKHLASYFRFMASKNRSEGIQRLSELIPALLYFYGVEIVNEVFRAIRDTARWWP